MADAVTSPVMRNDRGYCIHLTNLSDGTGETNVVKADRSALVLIGTAPKLLSIASIRWAIQGFSYIKLSWHAYTDATHTLDDTAMLLSGSGYDDFSPYGCLQNPNTVGTAVSGSIGDLLLSTGGAASG